MSQLSIEDLVDRILTVGQISPVDQSMLMSYRSISENDRELINRVFRALKRGELRVLS